LVSRWIFVHGGGDSDYYAWSSRMIIMMIIIIMMKHLVHGRRRSAFPRRLEPQESHLHPPRSTNL
jgi:hypothetical protein